MGVREVASALLGERRMWNPKSLVDMGLVEPRRGEGSYSYAAMNRPLTHSAVYACRNLLVRDISTLPVDVLRGTSEVAPPMIVSDPSPDPTVPVEAWVAQMVDSAVMRGNVFGLVTEVEPTGFPRKVKLISPDDVSTTRNARGEIEWYVFGSQVRLFQEGGDLWHVPLFPQPGALLGLSPLEHARTMIALGLDAQGFGSSFFRSPQPTGIISIDVPELNPVQTKQIKRTFIESTRDREPVVLSNVGGYTPLGIKPEESQFLATIAANDGQIARFFGVPGPKIGASTRAGAGTVQYSNIEQDQLSYFTDAVRPLLVVLEKAWSRLIPRGQRVLFNPDAILRVDTRTRYDAHASALQARWMTVNEVRALEDMPPMDGGDELPAAPLPAVIGGGDDA